MDVVPAAGMVGVPGGGEGEARVSPEHVSRDELCPLPQGFLPALSNEDPSLAVDELSAAVGFASGDVVADGVAGHVVVGEPVGGAAVAGTGIVAGLESEPVGEQVVVAEPLAPRVERDDEQVAPIELVEPVLGVVDARDGLAQVGVEPIEDGGGGQELMQALGKAGQDLVSQVVRDVAIVAGEPADELGAVRAVAQGEAHELHPGSPSFGAFGHPANVELVEADVHLVVEQRSNFAAVEAQIVEADLQQVSLRSQFGELERWVVAGADHDTERRRRLDDELVDAGVHGRVGDRVVVVEHQDRRRGPRVAGPGRTELGRRPAR